MPNRLDKFPPFLLRKSQYARARGIRQFRLRHENGEVLHVYLSDPDGIKVVRWPKVPIPGPVEETFVPEKFRNRTRMVLETSERDLARDIQEGITSYNALNWRG